MRERLNEAIEKTNAWLEGRVMFNRQDMLLLLAAARAYACPECAGTGLWSKSMPIGEDYRSVCPTCKADRELADS